MDIQPKKYLVIYLVEEGNSGQENNEPLLCARDMAARTGGTIYAAVAGSGTTPMEESVSAACDTVFRIRHALFNSFQPDIYARALVQLCNQIHPDVVILSQGIDECELAPRLAYDLEGRLITDCLELTINSQSGNLLCTKEVYGGNATAIFENEGRPAIATLRPKGLASESLPAGRGNIQTFEPAIDENISSVEVIENITTESENFDKADVVVAGGRGIGGQDGVKQLEALIQALKGHYQEVVLGGSRPCIDEGWMSGFRQIGLTGEKVNPQIYFAVGISGALQHMTGIFGSKKIVAINNNSDAAIFKYADYGIVGDYKEILPSLTSKIEE